ALGRARHEGIELLAVQHHHAHLAACLADAGLSGRVVGVCFDGAGHGPDGTVWGGEVLVGDARAVQRVASLRAVRLPGGDRAAREPWRMAVAHLMAAGIDPRGSAVGRRVDARALETVIAMVEKGVNAPLTSSVGRLFDAVASLAGLHDHVSFEGQAPMHIESLASGTARGGAYVFERGSDGVFDAAPVVRAIVDDVDAGAGADTIARRFHAALADVVVETCTSIASARGLEVVVLGGGVFSNVLLTTEVTDGLSRRGLRVHRPTRVPPNDGGLSFGQLAIAAALDGEGA
ncbi:MAG: carbamoyltransferase HypF, partial [Polyangiaceae bacterium]